MSEQKPKMQDPKSDQPDEAVAAIGAILSALRPLNDIARAHVLEFVVRHLGIQIGTRSESSRHHSPGAAIDVHPVTPAERPIAPTDIRSFATEKSPKTVNERVALVAYYLAHLAPPSERRDYIVSDDISTYFIQAGFPLPTAAHMTLPHAKNAGYLNALQERGQYKLNAVGYNLVAHKLPGGEAGEPRRRSARKPARRKSATKKKK